MRFDKIRPICTIGIAIIGFIVLVMVPFVWWGTIFEALIFGWFIPGSRWARRGIEFC